MASDPNPGGWGTPTPPPPPSPMGAPPPSQFGASPPGGENNLAIASLVLGALSSLSLFCCCIPFVGTLAYVFAPVSGIAAIVTGLLGLRHAETSGLRRSEAIAGIALGSVGVAAALLVLGLAVLGVGASVLSHGLR